ncbi:3'-5' exoribonuclease domain-containing protein [Patescibacteria group bacterium]
MKKPFSENLIFVDTEFTSLDPHEGEILSIGLVKMNGEELYLELEYDGEVDEWVKENVFPSLNQEKIKREDVIDEIRAFVGKKRPRVVAYVDNFDVVYLCKLLGTENFQEMFYWIPVDFSSILFAHGVSPDSISSQGRDYEFLDKLGVEAEKYNQHNALDDAKFLREVYLKFFEKLN